MSDLEEVEVWSAEQALQLIAQGNQRRVVTETRANEFSSRSHAIVQLTMLRQTENNTALTSKLSLVDLAGSERQNVYGEGRGSSQSGRVEYQSSFADFRKLHYSTQREEEGLCSLPRFKTDPLTQGLKCFFHAVIRSIVQTQSIKASSWRAREPGL